MKTLIVPICIIFFLASSIYAQNDDLRIRPTLDYTQTENSISIDPTNHKNMIATFIGISTTGEIKTPYFFSHDGGITWAGSDNSPNSIVTKGDPFVIFNKWGDAFFISKSNAGINFFKSTNKGESWITKPKLTTSTFADKPHINIGVSESNKDHVYAVWTHAEADNYKVYFRRSTDRGESFGLTQTIYSNIDYEGLGAYVTASPNGNVYVTFVKLTKSGTQTAILVFGSNDGGQTFSQSPGLEIPLQGMGNPTAPNDYFNDTRVNSFPYMAFDNSGTAYLVYTNNTSTDGGDIHIYLRKSTNWNNIMEVHSDQGIRQWFPSIAIDHTDGKIYISYYNMIYGSPNFTTYRNIAISTDGGSSFNIEQISDVSFIPEDIGVSGYAGYMGDYYEIAALNGIAYPFWSDNRSGIFQAYISPVGGAEVILDQKLVNNTTVDKIDKWSNYEFKELEIPKIYHFIPGDDAVLRGEQGIIANEKYNKWNITDDVKNHQVFIFQLGTENLISQFKPTNTAILIKNSLESTSLDGGKIEFKDPWYIDYTDGYGNRNRGMSGAVFHQQDSPLDFLQPEFSDYLGVFMNQEYDPNGILPFYKVRSPIQQPNDIYLTQTGRYHKFYFNNWSSVGTDPLTQNNIVNGYYETPVVFRSSNATVTANLKGTQISNQSNAYSNSGQRRFIQTPDGIKHIVYTSMDRVWYELSTDGGATWILGNGGKPLSSADSKNPSMSFYGNQVGIAWQEHSVNGYKIGMAVFYGSNYSSSVFSTVADEVLSYSVNANPVLAFGYSISGQGNVMVAWSGGIYHPFYSQAIMFRLGFASSNGISWTSSAYLTETDANSINPTIIADYTDDISNPFNYHLAWEQTINTSNSKVNYCRLYYQNNQLNYSAIEEASQNSGYTKNYKPLITLRKAFGLDYISISWIGYRQYATEEAELEKVSTESMSESRALVRTKTGSNWTGIGVYGNNVVAQNLNRGTTQISNQQVLGFVWSETSGSSFTNKMRKIPVSSSIFTLNTYGKDIQVNNSVSLNDMHANSYSSATLPYTFNLSQNFGSISKVNILSVYNGREGVIGRNGGQFYFAIGDIILDGDNIDFTAIEDSTSISTSTEFSSYLVSEEFTVNDNSSLVYGVQYGITDTLLCFSALENGRQVNFRVELFDPVTNEILGMFDNITFSENDVIQYNNIGYQVNLSGIGNRTLKLRLVVDYNSDFSFSLSDRYADESLLAKNKFRTVNYKGSLAVTEYSLEQNFPNPYNPVTTIRYQIPGDGFVTLKVFDILGNEISTLVNEAKIQGRYEIVFDAGHLASGVYLYKIQVGDFTDTKKMILLK